MRRSILSIAAGAAIGVVISGTGAARAGTVSYNANVADTGAPNNYLYFGAGNPNGNFVVSDSDPGQNDNIELGLRANMRYGNLIAGTQIGGAGSGNYYTVPAGESGGAALWDFVYSIQVPAGTISDYLSGGIYNVSLTVTAPGGATASFDPLNGDGDVSDNGTNSDSSIQQNAENIAFGAGDPNLPGLYTFDLTVSGDSGTLASDEMFVNVAAVPLPASAWSGLALLGGLGLLGAIKRHRKQLA